jgi:multidrug transporter EmrE-like cation transporter
VPDLVAEPDQAPTPALITAPTTDPTTDPPLVGWGALWSAIALNVCQVFLLDGSEGLRRPALLPLVAVGFLAELWLFGRAVRCLSPVIAYAAYGTTPAAVTVLSVALFDEALTFPKVVGVAAITVGVVLLATGGTGTGTPRAECARAPIPRPTTKETS